MNVNEMLNDVASSTTDVQFNYSNLRGIEQFHLFVKDKEIGNGITLPEDQHIWMVQFYMPRVYINPYTIIEGTHREQDVRSNMQRSVLYYLPEQIDVLQEQLKLHIVGKSDAVNEIEEELKVCDELHKTVSLINDVDKKYAIINRRLDLLKDFEEVYDAEDFS